MKRSAAEAPIRLGAAADLSKPSSKRRPLRWFIAVPARMALDSGVIINRISARGAAATLRGAPRMFSGAVATRRRPRHFR